MRMGCRIWHCVPVVLSLFVTMGCEKPAPEEPVKSSALYSHQYIVDAMERAFDWQIDNIVYSAPLPDGGFQDVSDTEWVRGAFFAGVVAAFEATGDRKYLDAAKEISERNRWRSLPASVSATSFSAARPAS